MGYNIMGYNIKNLNNNNIIFYFLLILIILAGGNLFNRFFNNNKENMSCKDTYPNESKPGHNKQLRKANKFLDLLNDQSSNPAEHFPSYNKAEIKAKEDLILKAYRVRNQWKKLVYLMSLPPKLITDTIFKSFNNANSIELDKMYNQLNIGASSALEK
jgi:hypothetical protein